MDEDNKKRERELSLVQGALARVLLEEQQAAARPAPGDGTGDAPAAIAIHLPAKEDYRVATPNAVVTIDEMVGAISG